MNLTDSMDPLKDYQPNNKATLEEVVILEVYAAPRNMPALQLTRDILASLKITINAGGIIDPPTPRHLERVVADKVKACMQERQRQIASYFDSIF